MRIITLIAKIKYKYDLVQTFMPFVTLAVMVYGFSDKLQALIPLNSYWLVIIFIPVALIGMLVAGHLMDKMQYSRSIAQEQYNRVPQIVEMQKDIKEMKDELKNYISKN